MAEKEWMKCVRKNELFTTNNGIVMCKCYGKCNKHQSVRHRFGIFVYAIGMKEVQKYTQNDFKQ